MSQINYAVLIARIESEVTGDRDLRETLREAAEAIRTLHARADYLEAAIRTHRAFAESHDNVLNTNDGRLWALLWEKS
jgi:hypothetical protein